MKTLKRIASMALVFLMLFVQAAPVIASETGSALNDTSLTIYVGDVVTLSVPDTGSETLTWSTSKKSVARVSTTGEVTGRKAGRATITAVSGDKSYEWDVTVKKVALDKKKVTIVQGKTSVISLEGAEIKSIKSSKPKVATVNEDGTITAVKVGSAKIKVTSDKGKKYTCSVKVTPGLDYAEVTLAQNDTARITLNGAKVKKVESDDPSIADITTDGEITAKTKGTAKLTVTDTKKKKYVCDVKVETPSLNESSLSMDIGDKYALMLHYNTQDVSWSSNNDSVVAVTPDGEVTAKDDGAAEITAVVASGSSYTCAVNVKEKEIVLPDTPAEAQGELALEASKEELSAGKGRQTVYFYAKVNAKEADITLYNKANNQKAADMLDNGALADNGDQKENDGIYSAKLDLDPDKDGVESYHFYAKTTVNGTEVSSKDITIKVVMDTVTPDKPTMRLSSTRKDVSVGSSQLVYFYVKSDRKSDNVALYNKADDTKVSDMWDDGKYTQNGDDIPNDNIYSAKLSLNPQSAEDYSYYAAAEVNGEKKISNDLVIKVYTQLTEEEITQMKSVDDDLQKMFSEFGYQDMTEEQKIEKVGELLSTLEENGSIKPDSVCYDEESANYSFVYNCGVYGIVSVKSLEAILQNGNLTADGQTENIEVLSGTTESEDIAEVKDSEAQEAADETLPTVSGDAAGKKSTGENLSVSGNQYEELWQRRAELDPIDRPAPPLDSDEILPVDGPNKPQVKASILYSRDNPSGAYYEKWKAIQNDLKKHNVDVELNSAVLSVENYKKAFSGKDLVMIHSHGSRCEIKGEGTYSVVCLRDPASAAKDQLYKDDLKAHRLVKATTVEGTFYWVLPSFFSYYYSEGNQINDAIVYMGMCLGAGEGSKIDYTLEAELQEAGAAAVLAYHNSVYTQYNIDMAKSIVDELMNGEDIGTAVEHAKNKNGKTDVEWAYKIGANPGSHPAATLILDGRKEKTLLHAGLLNGSFEESSYVSGSRWKYVGDARILTNLAELSPQEGSQMAIITTGLGSAEASYKGGTEGSYIYQYFKVPSGAKTISFSYDVVSEEPMEFVGSVYDDWFEAQLLDQSGNLLPEGTIVRESVNISKWHPISGIDFEGGDHTTYHTEWATVEADISKYEGEYIAIRFVVSDVGDSIYDTAVLIDDVYVDGMYLQ